MINIDKYAYSSKLRKVDPMEKFIFAVLTLAVCLWADISVISIAVFCIMTLVTVVAGGIPPRFFMKLLMVPMSFLVIGVFTIAVNISTDSSIFMIFIPISDLWIGISRIGLYKAGNLFFKALGTISCLYFLSLTTNIVDLLAVFRKLNVPSLMIEMMSLTYRFIFVLLDTAHTMLIAQNSRLGYENPKTGYRSLGLLASTLFIRAYKRSNDIFTALEARGYNGELNVVVGIFEKSGKIYIMTAIVNSILILVALYVK